MLLEELTFVLQSVDGDFVKLEFFSEYYECFLLSNEFQERWKSHRTEKSHKTDSGTWELKFHSPIPIERRNFEI